MKCQYCSGTGNEICQFCYGNGCDKCLNNGFIQCWECKGEGIYGEFGPTVYSKPNNNLIEAKGNILCPDCNGNGIEICPKCYGKKCNDCSEGYIVCFECNGTGFTGKFGPTIHPQVPSFIETISLISLGFALSFITYKCLKFYVLSSPETLSQIDIKNYNSKSIVEGKPLWRHAELESEELIKKIKPEYGSSEFKWQAQKFSHTQNARLDFWGYKQNVVAADRSGVIVDIKYVDKLQSSYIDQLQGYAGPPFFAKEKIIICRQDTIIPKIFNDANIKIIKHFPL